MMNFLIDRLSQLARRKKKALSIVIDMFFVGLSLWLAYLIRLDGTIHTYEEVWAFFVLLPPMTCAIFHSLGIYRWIVRSSNALLFRQIVKGSAASVFILMVLMFVGQPENIYTRSVVAVYAIVFTGLSLGWRSLWRFLLAPATQLVRKGNPVAIYGAGHAGRTLREFLQLRAEKNVVLFLDDDSKLRGGMVGGVPVYQPDVDNLQELLLEYGIKEVVLALPDVKSDSFRRVQERLAGLDLTVSTIPSLTELSSGVATWSDVRKISVGDILGRTEVPPDAALLQKCVTGKSVMVTGGGGSIGSEICQQVLRLRPSCLVVLDSSEHNVYRVTEELNDALASLGGGAVPMVVTTLGSIGDKEKVSSLIEQYKVDTIYHAAAFKHVPVLEHDPEQAIINNVFGTLTLLEAAIDKKVGTFILISSDKAVRPTNVMGATKRLAELILQAKADTNPSTCIAMVRFGNVLGSSGSVVPKFKRQISAGGPLTVTHKEITRFFMTIPEAAQLVLQAGAMAQGGEVFVLDMGEPVNIHDFAVSMIELSGKKVGPGPNEIDIKIVGLRPGEKMYEELFISSNSQKTQISKIFVDRDDFLEWSELSRELDRLKAAVLAPHTRDDIRECLLGLINLEARRSIEDNAKVVVDLPAESRFVEKA